MKKAARLLVCIGACSVIAACSAADPSGDAEDIGQSEGKLLAGRVVPEVEAANVLRQAGFPESAVGQMICTMKYESSFYEKASNKNKNGTTDYGLLQINSVHLGDRGCPADAAGLDSAADNVRCALAVYKSQGINAWYGYKAHRTECDRYPAPAAGATPAAPNANAGASGGTGNPASGGAPSGSAPKGGAGDAGKDSGPQGLIPGTCTHDVCTAGDKLGQACDACTMKVCASDPYCCDTFWGLSCFDSVAKYCGKTCG
jgi:hypothetical protein